jgi:hypothetical protein
MKLRVKNKQNKKLLSTKLHKSRWVFFKLLKQVEGLILKCVLYFKFLSLKMYEVQQISAGAKVDILSEKYFGCQWLLWELNPLYPKGYGIPPVG